MRGFCHHEWTEERTELFKNLCAEGLSHSQIAARLGITRNASCGKAHRLGLSRGKGHAANGRIGGIALRLARKPKRSHGKSFQFGLARTTSPRPARDEAAGVSVLHPFLADAPPSLNIKLENLEPHHCRYIAGDDRLFCGNEQREGSSYCGFHAALCGGWR